MSSALPSETIPFGRYLFARLTQLGCHSIHGLPGDYNLTLLDHVVPSGARWVGNCNELNAGYAADGYARLMSLVKATATLSPESSTPDASSQSSLVPGCLVTTYGVGELSALNAIAGAYAERVPLVHIVGTPRRDLAKNQVFIHHALDVGDYGRFREASKSMVCHTARVGLNDEWDAKAEVEVVERAFEMCLKESRPVYIDVPADIVDKPVPKTAPEVENIDARAMNGNAHTEQAVEIVERIHSAKMPVVVVDGESLSLGLLRNIDLFVRKSGIPTFCTVFGKSMIDETIPNFMGINVGAKGLRPYKDIFDEADLIIFFGPHYSDTNTTSFETIPDKKRTISFDRSMQSASSILDQVVNRLDYSKVQSMRPELATRATRTIENELSAPKQDAPIDQDSFYVRMSSFFRDGDVICSETGTTGIGCRDFTLPKHSILFNPVTWLSIGYMLGAAQGAALAVKDLFAKPDRSLQLSGRTILFEGDGSFQLTFQEISTMVRHKLDVIIFVVNNYGYTIEKCIHGWEEEYNNVADWNYLDSLNVFRGGRNNEKTGEKYTWRAENWGQLFEALNDKRLSDGKGVRMVEVVMGPEDAPLALIQATGDRRPSKLRNETTA